MWVKYPDVIRRYTPFILLSMAQGEVITEYQNYEARERMRRLLFGHAFDINDGEFEVHHPELAVDTDPIEEIMLKDNIKRLREVLCYLSETQKRRVFKYFFYNKTLEKIADEEGVDFTSVYLLLQRYNLVKECRIRHHHFFQVMHRMGKNSSCCLQDSLVPCLRNYH